MKIITSLLALVLLQVVFGQDPKTQYVEPNSARCRSDGLQFTLSNDRDKSDLFNHTQLAITLYTLGINNGVKEMVPVRSYTSGQQNVDIKYEDYAIVADILYGPNKQPLLYSIRQPFMAVPTNDGIVRNYSFHISCTIGATARITNGTNTGESGPGDGDGEVVDPVKHISTKLDGLRDGGFSLIGDPLTYTIGVTEPYSSIMPIECKYHNPGAAIENNYFIVTNGCPLDFDDPNGWFGKMKRTDDKQYTLNFKAFTFAGPGNDYNLLAITCDFLLCFTQNEPNCYKECWGPRPPPPTEAPPPPTEAPPPPTEAPPPPTEAPPPPTEAPPPPTEAPPPPTEETFRGGKVIRSSFGLNLVADKFPDRVVKSSTVRVQEFPDNAICTDSSLLTALYAVIGVLAGLLLILVVGLIYLLYAARQRKVSHAPYLPPEYHGNTPAYHIQADKLH